jgi:hypothetical protein
VVDDLPIPEPASGEVGVRTAAVNGFHLSLAAGLTKDCIEHRFPLV